MDQCNGGFAHRIDKKSIPVCSILGVELAAINMPWLLDFTDRNLKDLSGDYICVSNVHTTVTAYQDSAYRAVQNGGILAIPDGGPLSSTGRRRGYPDMQRVTGPDYMQKAITLGLEKGWKHYFYGSTQETLDILAKELPQRYPGIQIAGMYSPPFRPMTEEEDRQIIEKMNAAGAEFIWVGVGGAEPVNRRWGRQG